MARAAPTAARSLVGPDGRMAGRAAEPLLLPTELGTVDALEFGPRDAPLVVAIQGKSANPDVIAEWEPACRHLAGAGLGFHVILPNLHSNARTKPGTVSSADVQKILRDICRHC